MRHDYGDQVGACGEDDSRPELRHGERKREEGEIGGDELDRLGDDGRLRLRKRGRRPGVATAGIERCGWNVLGVMRSPVVGARGAVEFLLHARRGSA